MTTGGATARNNDLMNLSHRNLLESSKYDKTVDKTKDFGNDDNNESKMNDISKEF